jgi:hypothetical protein
MRRRTIGSFVVQGKSDLDSHLPVDHPALFDVPPSIQHLEPAKVPDRLGRLGYGALHRVFHSSRGRAYQLDVFIDVIRHDDLQVGKSLTYYDLLVG